VNCFVSLFKGKKNISSLKGKKRNQRPGAKRTAIEVTVCCHMYAKTPASETKPPYGKRSALVGSYVDGVLSERLSCRLSGATSSFTETVA
jgi:hypothetical protein